MKRLLHRILSLLLIFISNTSPVFSDDLYDQSYQTAVKYFRQESYFDAEAQFSQSIGYKARLGQALSAYYLNQPEKAQSLFMQSVLLADSDTERYTALYNAASCSFIAGDYSMASRLFRDAAKYQPESNKLKPFIVASDYLAKMVLAQIARDQSAVTKNKSSEGKKTIPALEFVFDDDINLRIEDGESTDSETTNQQAQLISDKKILNELIASGINAVRIKQEGTELNMPSLIDHDIRYEFSNIDSASYTPSSAQPDLWIRIFELEAGFPARLEQAERKPGVRAW
ncbi:MAG: hypothetical protein OEY29_13350 [Gammaproteobacteria bacterium]|nr:hypothetical protein [Gammaproteobacteria bacterium]